MSMKLSDIAEKIGIPVVQLTPQAIMLAKDSGRITGGEEQKLLAELKEADRIWENPVPGVEVAESLWAQ